MPILATKGQPQEKLFHNERIKVFPDLIPLDQIAFWAENDRTLFTFEKLELQKKKKLDEIPLKEIVEFVADQEIHEIQRLADSIQRNGIQVPLIISDSGKLLDGNRRFFATHLARLQLTAKGKPLPDHITSVPVWIVRQQDLDKNEALELKILAEANFVPDLKVTWPLDAQARAVEHFYEKLKSTGKSEDEAINIIKDVFGIEKTRAADLLESLQVAREFVKSKVEPEEQVRLREIVQDKFVYFWEFRNKALKGRGKLEPDELQEVKPMFFSLMARGRDNPIKNVKQVEPLIRAYRDPEAWDILAESKGTKLSLAITILNEKKEIRKAEDKIRLFLNWLKSADELSPNAQQLLKQVRLVALEKLS